MPGSIKSYHTLGYEGSQSRVEGIKNILVNDITWQAINPPTGPDGKYAWNFDIDTMSELIGTTQWGLNSGGPNGFNFEGKHYRNNILIYSGAFRAFDNTNGIHVRKEPDVGDVFEIGDIITTQLQEDSVDYSNSTPKDGWHVSSITTDKEKGSLLEFIEKEGKWFNYIKGLESNVEDLDFGSFEVQGLGIQSEMVGVNTNGFGDGTFRIFIDGGVNSSLQVGDAIYYQPPGSDEVISAGVVVTNPSFYDGITGPTQDLFQVTVADLFSNPPGPSTGAYWMFVKNQVINMSGLSGYYADAMFENNSKVKAELFAVGSEITESSK
tara:strand:- start:372 stop:1340 length:969 start_codon:yes stop_codon:yes gene_type:complete